MSVLDSVHVHCTFMIRTVYTCTPLQVQQLSAQVSALQSSREELEALSEGHMTRVREAREEQAAIEEQLRKELAQQVWPGLCSVMRPPHYITKTTF